LHSYASSASSIRFSINQFIALDPFKDHQCQPKLLTAIMAYAKALQAALSTATTGDTIKFN